MIIKKRRCFQMLNKNKRLEAITKIIEEKGTVRVSEIVTSLNVSDMTVRRDFTELEELGILKRIHGGAKSKNTFQYKELSHEDKYVLNIEKKREIALKAVKLIEEGDTIFLGPGTTVELLAKEISLKSLKVLTNCLPIFEILSEKKSETFNAFLVGGEFRKITRSFVGEIANMTLKNINFNKTFFSCNAIKENDVMTSTFEESYTQEIVLNNSDEKYLLVDDSKFEKVDFINFYTLDKLTGIVINNTEKETLTKIEKYVNLII